MISRKIDGLGRIVIPKGMRSSLGLEENMPVDISMTKDGILIRKGQSLCRLCGKELDMQNRFFICKNCLTEIQNVGLT